MSHTRQDFNPTNNVTIDSIKEHTDNMIDFITDNVPAGEDRKEAIKNYKQASMWAVRAVFQ
jgi:hypothetical protein